MTDPSFRSRQSHPVSRRSRYRRQIILRGRLEDSAPDGGHSVDGDEIDPAVLPILRLLTPAPDPKTGAPSDMSRYKRLLTQMPKIAGVINQFESPEVQREVIQALIRAFETEEERRTSMQGRAPEPHGDRDDAANDVLEFSRGGDHEPDLAAALLRQSDTHTDEEEGSSIHAL